MVLGARLRRLLAGLLGHRNGEVGRNDLIGIIWGEHSEPANAEATLRQYVSRLRRALAAAETGGDELVVTTPTGYRLVAAPGTVDIDEVAEMLSNGLRPHDFDTRFAGQPFGAYGDEAWCHAPVAAMVELLDRARLLPIAPGRVSGPAPDASHRFPRPATELIGRDELIESTLGLLAGERLITLTGVGGVGKTRLALAVAHAGIDAGSYPGGAWFADLTPVRQETDVADLVARLVGVEVTAATAVADLARFVAGRRCLLVLDNCEHVIDACAGVAAAVLTIGGSATVLTSSRERLDVDGEMVVDVPPLSVSAGPTPAPAVRLFVERAVAVNPEVDLGNAGAVSDLVTALDGIPLAIELAASRTLVASVPELMAGLDDRLSLLSPRRRRSRTMEAAIDWSYQLLDPTEKRVFRAIGLFVDGADLPAVAAVAGLGVEDGRDAVEALVLKSMVRRSPHGGSTTRFRMFETLRAFALRRLEDEGEDEQARRRFVRHYSTKVGRHPHHRYYTYNFFADAGDDRRNIVAGAEFAADQRRWIDAGWLLKAAVGLGTVGSSSAPLLPAVEACARHLGEGTALREQVLGAKTNCHLDAGDFEAAATHASRMTRSDDRFTACMATVFLGFLALYGDPARALRLIDDHLSVAPAQPLDDLGMNATTLRVSALAHLERLEECEAEIARYVEIENASGIRQHSGVLVVVTNGVLAWIRGDHDRIYQQHLIDRYALPDGSMPLSTVLAADFLRALSAAAGEVAEPDRVVAAYAGRALEGRARLEANSAVTAAAVLAAAEGDGDRAAELLRSGGYTSPGVVRLVANDLARRLGIDLAAPDDLTDLPARQALVSEARRRGWDLAPGS